jgi:hypothetical protein
LPGVEVINIRLNGLVKKAGGGMVEDFSTRCLRGNYLVKEIFGFFRG